MNNPPDIHDSTCEQRIAYVREQWKCLNHCPSCGKCHILKGKDAEELYGDYIEGTRQYIEITKEIRQK